MITFIKASSLLILGSSVISSVAGQAAYRASKQMPMTPVKHQANPGEVGTRFRSIQSGLNLEPNSMQALTLNKFHPEYLKEFNGKSSFKGFLDGESVTIKFNSKDGKPTSYQTLHDKDHITTVKDSNGKPISIIDKSEGPQAWNHYKVKEDGTRGELIKTTNKLEDSQGSFHIFEKMAGKDDYRLVNIRDQDGQNRHVPNKDKFYKEKDLFENPQFKKSTEKSVPVTDVAETPSSPSVTAKKASHKWSAGQIAAFSAVTGISVIALIALLNANKAEKEKLIAETNAITAARDFNSPISAEADPAVNDQMSGMPPIMQGMTPSIPISAQ